MSRNLSLLMGAAAAALPLLSPAGEVLQPPPPLVVVLSIDQFRGDYIPRFEKFFGEGGFRRILREGRYYDNCNYLSANTLTGPGHSTMLTGCYAHRSGITGNGWFDAAEGASRYCVSDADATTVSNDGLAPKKGSSSPRYLMSPTVGDMLEASTNGASHTVGVATKDRAAVLMAGHAADLALWWDNTRGQYVTSDTYAKALPGWLVAFNSTQPGQKWFQKQWDLSLPREEYEKLCTEDSAPGENAGSYTGTSFPHMLCEKSEAVDKDCNENLSASPFANELLVDAALAAVDGEKLGSDDVPDLLTVSFSSNDLIGHAFGPDSWEVMDVTIRTDKAVARLLAGLDDKVGKGKWTLFLTADHGICPLPEVMRAHGVPAARISDDDLRAAAEAHLAGIYGQPADQKTYIKSFSEPWLVLDASAAPKPIPADKPLARAAADFFARQPGVGRVYLESELLTSTDYADPVRRALLYAHYPGRSGDLAVIPAPFHFFWSGDKGTTHGSPYGYDQYVPLLAVGRGIAPGLSDAAVSPPQIAPTISLMLHLPPPADCEVPPLPGALAGRD